MKTKSLSNRKMQLAFAPASLNLLVASGIAHHGFVQRTQVRNLRDESLRQSWWRQ
jgi:hypothetical protein